MKPTVDDHELSEFAINLVHQVVDAANHCDRDAVRSLSILGVGADRVVSRYMEFLAKATPLEVTSSTIVSIRRGCFGPRWAPWVRNDRVRVSVAMNSATGLRHRELVVWIYHTDNGLLGQLANRLA